MSEAINKQTLEHERPPAGDRRDPPSPIAGPRGFFGRLRAALFPAKSRIVPDANATTPKGSEKALENNSDRECDSTPDASQPLCIRHLSKRFPSPDGKVLEALSDVSIDIFRRGENVAIVGPDGAGKTTLIRTIAGLLRPEGCEKNGRTVEPLIRVFGRTPDTDDPAFTETIGVMPQRFGLYEELSCRENLEFFAAVKGIRGEEFEKRFARLMHLTGLSGFEARLAGKLSGGMKQKLGLAATLMTTPDFIVLDEPTVGVDPLSRRELQRVLEDVRRTDGVTTLFSTAYLDEAASADRVYILEKGRIVACGTPSELLLTVRGRTWRAVPAETSTEIPRPNGKNHELGTAAHRLARTLMQSVSAVRADSPWLDAVPRGDGVDLLARAGANRAALERSISELAASGLAATLSERPETLEDAYAALTFEDDGRTPEEASVETVARSGTACGAFSKVALKTANNTTGETAAATSDPVIRAEHISRRFGNFVAVADTRFEVKRGEIFGLLGPNGAGKTTTFRMLCGLLPPSSGDIRIDGVDLLASASEARARIGYVAQKFSLYERLTVYQTLRYFGECYGVSGRALDARIGELLSGPGATLGIHLERRAGMLPLGAKRELAMACALLHRPAILFLDEATSGADLAARRAFWRRIVELARNGTTVVVTTHFMDEAEYCDRFLIQDAGRVLVLGSPAEVRRSAGAATVEEAFRTIVLENRAKEAEKSKNAEKPAEKAASEGSIE